MPAKVLYSLVRTGHSFHAAGDADFFAVVDDFAYRADDGSCTAEAGFSEFADFCEFNRTVFDFHAKHVRCDRDQGTAGDGRQDGVRFRRNQSAIFLDEEEVSAARFFYVRARSRVEEHVFIEAVLMSQNVRIHAHGIVQAGFDMPVPRGAARSKSEMQIVIGLTPFLKYEPTGVPKRRN